MLHVSVFTNGSCSNGRLVKVNTVCWPHVIRDISSSLDIKVSRIFTHDGTEISCSQQLNDGQVIFVSDGEDFIHLDVISKSNEGHDFLDLDVQESQIAETQTYISNLSQFLGHLRIGVNIQHGGHLATPFNPTLPVLKTLKIDFLCRSSATSYATKNYLESFFSVLEPAQMPLLQEFNISTNGLSKKSWLFNSREIKFESVTKLEVVNLTYLEDNWIQYFPNVKEMTVEGHSQSFRKILSTMTPLEHLVLKMKKSRGDDAKINAVFAGMLHPEAAYYEIQQFEAGKQKLTPKVKKAMAFRAPILNLTGLKKLELELRPWSDEDENYLEDSGVYFSLLQIQPLDFLRLRYVSISGEMEGKLREHHKHFVRESK